MFLTELYNYYHRMIENPKSGMAPLGYSEENIGFVLRLSPQGRLLDALNLLSDKGRPRRLRVPASVKRTAGIKANFLWDNTGYALGADGKGKPERTAKTFAAFRELHLGVAESSGNARLLALAAFLEQWHPEDFAGLPHHEAMLDQNLVFQVEGDEGYLHEQPDVKEIWERVREGSGRDDVRGICLISGREGSIAPVHPAIKGVVGAQSSGADLVSFNCDAFTSYGKTQGYNAPVSRDAAAAYTTALNYLTRGENRHSLRLGDTTMVFWAERPSPVEALSLQIFAGGSAVDENVSGTEDGKTVARVYGVLRGLREGLPLEACPDLDERVQRDADLAFFILGLAPNQARLVARFWQTSTFGELAKRIGRYYAELAIARPFPDTQPEFPPFRMLLRETAAQGKDDNIPKFLPGALARSVFSGTPYPPVLYAAVQERIRADKKISYPRAALIKAYLTRNHPEQGELFMYLDPERNDAPYLLGRAFALLEGIQGASQDWKINRSVKDSYFNSAAAMPAHIFPLLIQLSQHHLRKLKTAKPGLSVTLEKELKEIMARIGDLPLRLSIVQQGLFQTGYFQQSVSRISGTEKE